MNISKAHLKRLQLAQAMRGKSLSTFKMLINNWKYYLLVSSIFGIAAYFFIYHDQPGFCLFLTGTFFGLVLRDIAWYRITARFWPVSDAITDWEKVEALIKENGG